MHDDDDDDPEFPDASDMDDGDSADQDVLERCPACKRMVYVDAERCPYCGSYITPARHAAGLPVWVIVTAVLCLAAFLWIGLH